MGHSLQAGKERSEREAFDRLKAELARAFAAPDESFHPLSATDVIVRNKEDVVTSDRVQESAALRIDEIHRYTRDQWATVQADARVGGLFEAFDRIATGGVFSRPIPAKFGVDGQD